MCKIYINISVAVNAIKTNQIIANDDDEDDVKLIASSNLVRKHILILFIGLL